MRRTFIGLKVEPDSRLLHLYYQWSGSFNNPHFHWINPDNLHLTLRFLGNTDDGQIATIIQQLEIFIPRFPIFDIEIQGIGVFGSRSFPEILWAGVKMPKTAFAINEDIENIVCDAGFERVTKPYSPHLTLCRIRNLKETADFNHLLNEYKDAFIMKQEIKEVNLYESILRSSGSVYTILHSFFLNNKGSS